MKKILLIGIVFLLIPIVMANNYTAQEVSQFTDTNINNYVTNNIQQVGNAVKINPYKWMVIHSTPCLKKINDNLYREHTCDLHQYMSVRLVQYCKTTFLWNTCIDNLWTSQVQRNYTINNRTVLVSPIYYQLKQQVIENLNDIKDMRDNALQTSSFGEIRINQTISITI